MPKAPLKIAGFIAALLAVFCLSGCSSMRPIASEPPVPGIFVTAPFSVSIVFRSAAFPAGRYLPSYEDNGGYYYQAPTKIVERGLLLNHICDGGLYVKRGTKEAKQWYVIEGSGGTFFGRFDATLQNQAIP